MYTTYTYTKTYTYIHITLKHEKFNIVHKHTHTYIYSLFKSSYNNVAAYQLRLSSASGRRRNQICWPAFLGRQPWSWTLRTNKYYDYIYIRTYIHTYI